MQTGYELVRNAIAFTGPERVPVNFDSNRSPEIETKYGDDLIWVFVGADPDFVPAIPGADELGIVSETLDSRVFGLPVIHPLNDWAKLEHYHFPDYTKAVRYRALEAAIAANRDQYILGMFPHFLFQHMMHLVGFEKLMTSLVMERQAVEELRDRMVASCIQVVHCMADRGVNGLIAIEDLGLQERMFISPRLWREIYKPGFARIIEAAHSRGLHVFSHTCGYIENIIEDLIEIKLDVLQLDQQDHMGIERLGERFGGRICFFCPVDIQTTLCKPGGLPAIESKVKQLIWNFGRYHGGFMAKTYPQPESIQIPEENNAFMCEQVRRYGRYPLSFQP